MKQPLDQQAHDVARLLISQQQRIIFAESCTAGLVSAVLGRVPGVSGVHCGSAVVYRLDTKTKWLGVPPDILVDPGPVSECVARLMVEGVLARTPEATMAASITGHLGPGAPSAQDGLVYIGVGFRNKPAQIFEHRLTNIDAMTQFPGATLREQRQWAAADLVLRETLKVLSSGASAS
ncbi:CinA family protein [Schlesneria sp. DSM 10557]|uniref:CinA family protein n=1 Tax=Schlesneria sp. DSM 10557 TaxID=3044399 RepID=UPI0035A14A20